jgi:hypothetical protein
MKCPGPNRSPPASRPNPRQANAVAFCQRLLKTPGLVPEPALAELRFSPGAEEGRNGRPRAQAGSGPPGAQRPRVRGTCSPSSFTGPCSQP